MHTLTSLGHRQQLLLRHLLHNPQGLTLDQLAKLLSISRNAVTQHISALEKLNCIQSRILPSGGGRPSRAYLITDSGKDFFPKQYGLFSTMLMKTMSSHLGAENLSGLLSKIGVDLAQNFKQRVKKSNDQIDEVRKIMDELGYETQQPTGSDNANEIIAVNCIFHDLASENNDVCELDNALLEELLDADIEQKECMVKGGEQCRFCVTMSN